MNVYSKKDLSNLRCIGLSEHKCYSCNKTFECSAEYLYKKRIRNKKDGEQIYFCSWTCMRKFEQEKEKKRSLKPMKNCECYVIDEDGIAPCEYGKPCPMAPTEEELKWLEENATT